MKRPLSDFASEPIFTARAVERRTGIAEHTLRAWEQRHRIVTPTRSRSGQRLYSERDVALLHWVRGQMLSGLNISQVAARLEHARQNNEMIWVDTPPDMERVLPVQKPLPPTSEWAASLYRALVSLDDTRATRILEQTATDYSAVQISVEIIDSAWQALTEARERGEILAVQAHFGEAFLRGYLQSLLSTLPQQPTAPYLLIACAPGDLHEADALLLAVLARLHGYRAPYLGPSIPVVDITACLRHGERPAMIIMTASERESALALAEAQAAIRRASGQRTDFGYSGRAFDREPGLREQVAGVYLGPGSKQALAALRATVPLGS